MTPEEIKQELGKVTEEQVGALLRALVAIVPNHKQSALIKTHHAGGQGTSCTT